MRLIKLISTLVLLLGFCAGKAHGPLLSAQTKEQIKTKLLQTTSKKDISVSNTGKVSKNKRKRKSRIVEVGFELCCFALTTAFTFKNDYFLKECNNLLSYSFHSNRERGPPAGVKV